MIISENPEKTIIRYDRNKKTWQAVNGTVTNTGPGPDGKRAAQRLALVHDWPELADVVAAVAYYHADHEQIMRRLMKATELLVAGNVYGGEVRSQSDANRFYRIRFDGTPRTYSCTCEDYQSGRAPHSIAIGGRVCKHALAQHLAFLLGLELDTPPVPYNGEATNVVEF